MTDITVKPVSSGREKRLFLDFPWRIYRDDPHWVPPLRMSQEALVGYKSHPFYDDNRAQTFLAWCDGEVVGRIAAILNQRHIDRHGERRGFFGFFESTDDLRVSAALFDAVRDWFAGQDIHALRGPVNPSISHETGLLIDGFDSSPTFLMTYNPRYYARLIEGYGFRKCQDLFAYVGKVDQLPAIQRRYLEMVESMIATYGVRLRTLDTRNFRRDVEAFLDVFNRSLSNTWGFVPMTKAEIRRLSGELRLLMVPELAVAAEIDGQMIGAVFCMPDYNPRIRQINGRLFPFGFLRLLSNKRAIKRLRVLSTNVLPEYQQQGLGLVLLHGLVPKVIEAGVEEVEFSWVLESNRLSRGSLEKGGARRTKTFRLYDWDK
jgi:GNAT superfamily N-acetyltransferase